MYSGPYQEVTALLFNKDARDSQKNPYEKRTVDLPTKKSRLLGAMPRVGAVLQMSMCASAFCMHSGARKRMLVLRWMHIWTIT